MKMMDDVFYWVSTLSDEDIRELIRKDRPKDKNENT